MTTDLDLFDRFTKQFVESPMTDIHRVGRNFFLAEKQLWEFKNGIKRDIYAPGLFLGEEKKGFSPSPALVDILSKLPDAQSRKVFINKKAEWLFLCGRNVLSDSILRNPNTLSEGLVLVQNEFDENLGYGLFKKEDTLIIKHILDKGRYLRIDEKGKFNRQGNKSKSKFHD